MTEGAHRTARRVFLVMLFSQQPYLTSSKTKEATNYVPSYFARHHRRRRHRRRKRSERSAFDFGFDSLARVAFRLSSSVYDPVC